MVAKPLCPLYKNIIKPLDRARYPELRYIIQQNTIATYDKESNALLTQYSVDQNDMGVTQMLLDGRAKMIPAGRRARFIKIIQGNAVVHIEGEAFNMIIPTSALIPE